MKLDISRQTLQKIIIGVVVLIIVVFVIMKIWRSSRYTWPNASELGSFSITAVSAAAAAGSTPALLTFTTGTTPHGYSAGDLVSITGVTNIVFAEPVTNIPLNASAGGATAPTTAVYIYDVPEGGTTFRVKGTQAAPVPSVSAFGAKTGTGSFTASQTVNITQTSSGATGTATVSSVSSGSITALSAITPGTGTFTAGSATVTPSTGTNPTQTVTISLTSPTITVNNGASVVAVSQPAYNKVQNTDLLTCQTTYATNLITSPTTMSTTSSQTISSASGGNKTVNVTSSTGFSPGDKVIIPGVVDSNNKSVVLFVESVTSTSIVFTQASTSSISSGTVLPSTAVSNITLAYNKRDQCVQLATNDYTIGHCKYLPQSGTGIPVVPLQSTDPVAFAAYQEYQTNIQKIQLAYAPAMSRVQQNQSFPTPGSLTGVNLTQADKQRIVEAARKADLANATQKYLATACPGFYALTSGSTVNDNSAKYKNWSVDIGSSAPTTATADSKKFWAPSSGIPDADIMKWAQNAGVVTLSGPVTSVTVTGNGLGSGYTSAPTLAFSAPQQTGGATATGTATISGNKITSVTITNGGSGYTSAPTISFSGGTGGTAPTASEVNAGVTVQISTTLTATGGLVTSGTFTTTTGTPTTYTYTSGKYNLGTAGSENWRIAYKNGPGTYPEPTYT